MIRRKATAFLLSMSMVLTMTPGFAFADDTAAGASGQTFVDMPSDWSTDALKSAAANGLINGYDGKTGKEIRATGNLSRAEMATMVNRAFRASTKASLSGVNDVASSAWYADDMAKAVQMGTFKADAAMRPDAKITRQEAFTVLARAFKVTDADSSKGLASFSDGANVASWAKDGVCGLVDKGYVAGANGALNPTANITRAEFAKIMDNMVKQYMKEANTYTTAASGNVMVNVPGAVLKDMTINGDLIIGDGVGTGNITLDGVKVTGRTVVRGGGVNSVIITGSSDVGSIIIAKVDGNVRVSVEGAAKVSTIIVNDGKDDVVLEGKIGSVEVTSATPVVVQKAEIGSISVTAGNADLTVAKDAKVDTLKNDAKGTTTSGEGKPGSTTGSEGVTNDKGETTKPPTGGGSGGSGNNSGGNVAVDSVVVRPAGPAVGTVGDYNYEAGYRNAGITVDKGTNKNDNVAAINVNIATVTSNGSINAALEHAVGPNTYAFVGLKFNKPAGATAAAVTIGGVAAGPIDLTTESDDVFGGEYIAYFGAAQKVQNDWKVDIEWTNESGTIATTHYTVNRVTDGVAKAFSDDGTFAYTTLAGAIGAAKAGGEVTLLHPEKEATKVAMTIDKKITLNGDGKTLGCGLNLATDVTVKNLNLTVGDSSFVETVVQDKTAVYITSNGAVVDNCTIKADGTADGKSINGVTVETAGVNDKTSLTDVKISGSAITALNRTDKKAYGAYSASNKVSITNNTINAKTGIGVENIISANTPTITGNSITKTGTADVYLMGVATYFAGEAFGTAGSTGLTGSAINFVKSVVTGAPTVVLVDTYADISDLTSDNLSEKYTYKNGIITERFYYDKGEWKAIKQAAPATVAATLADSSGSLTADKLATNYSASASRSADGIIEIAITAGNVQMHRDAAGRWGNWVGFGAEMPAVGQKLVIKCASTLDGLAEATERTVASAGADMTSGTAIFWTNYVDAGAAPPMSYWSLKFGEKDEVVYHVNLDGVTCADPQGTMETLDSARMATLASGSAFAGIEDFIATGVSIAVANDGLNKVKTYTAGGTYIPFTDGVNIPGFGTASSTNNFLVLPLGFNSPTDGKTKLTYKKYHVTQGKVDDEPYQTKTISADGLDLIKDSVYGWAHLLQVDAPTTADETTRFVLTWDEKDTVAFDLTFGDIASSTEE